MLPLHWPLLHTSPPVQPLLSLQSVVLLVNLQPLTALQLSSVHGLPSLQTTPVPATQTPPLHASPTVQTLPSLQGAVLALLAQPAIGSQESSVQTLLSLQALALPGTQTPALQASPTVHTLLSVQTAALATLTQPLTGSQLSSVHTLPSSQAIAFPAKHLLAAQTSPTVQTLPSSHGAELAECTQPLIALQLSVVQTFLSSQSTAKPATHLLATQASPLVHRLLSVQTAELAVLTQPFAISQLSLVQGLPSSQATLLPGWQLPPAHVSPTVQTLPSLHGAVLLALLHAPDLGSQVSVVQGFPSSHALGPLGVQMPLLQASPTVQPLLSSQTAVLLVLVHPVLLLQLSSVQGFPSSQMMAKPPTQLPAAQTSPLVHTEPSSQGAPLFVNTQPLMESQLSVVQTWPSSQGNALPGTQALAAQASPTVQTLLSVQLAEFAKLTQPFSGSQASSLQGLPSSQLISLPATQPPPPQASPTVQTEPSSQGSVLLLCEQPPEASQESVVQPLPSSQFLALPGMHWPPEHKSVTVQTLPSEQPAALLAVTQPCLGSQESSVQGLPSSHCRARPGTHTLPLQLSPIVHALLSVHGKLLPRWLQPALRSQTSSVQGFLSSHATCAPGRHCPPWHVSPLVQTLLSEHGAMLLVVTQPSLLSHESSVHGLPSLQTRARPGTHAPAAH